MTGCWFPHAKYLIATQALDWENDTFEAILLMETSTVLSDIFAQGLGDIGTLAEYPTAGTGYSRQPLVTTLVEEDPGVQVRFTADNISFANLGNGPRRARWTLVARDDGVPIFVIGRALGPIFPNGGDINTIIEAIL